MIDFDFHLLRSYQIVVLHIVPQSIIQIEWQLVNVFLILILIFKSFAHTFPWTFMLSSVFIETNISWYFSSFNWSYFHCKTKITNIIPTVQIDISQNFPLDSMLIDLFISPHHVHFFWRLGHIYTFCSIDCICSIIMFGSVLNLNASSVIELY